MVEIVETSAERKERKRLKKLAKLAALNASATPATSEGDSAPSSDVDSSLSKKKRSGLRIKNGETRKP